MLAGARLIAATRSPPTASVRLRKSVVVVTTWMRSCASPGDARTIQAATRPRRKTMALATPLRTRPGCSTLAGAGNPDALRHQAMDILLGFGNRPDPAIHRHAGQAIGVESRDFFLRLQPVDHAHGGIVHRLVEVGVLDVRDVIFRGLFGRTLHVLLVAGIFGIETVNAFLDVDDLRYTAIGCARHQSLRLID